MSTLGRRDAQHVLHPASDLAAVADRGSLCAVRGEGIYVYDERGREYIEAAAGAWCLGLSHGDAELAEVAAAQMRTLSYVPAFYGRGSEPVVMLAEKLTSLAPFEASKVLFVGSGSEANESLLRLLWFANNIRGEPQRKTIISRQHAYHGSAGFTASLTGLPVYHSDFDAPAGFVRHLACPHLYRYGHRGETEEQFVARLCEEAAQLIESEGPETFAAVIAEPVMAAGGVRVPPSGYFPALQAVLERYGIPAVADEVVTGFGRTGAVWGSETTGMRPNAISAAKQLSAAYIPIGALLIDEDFYEAVLEGSRRHGVLGHGFTYSGHPVAAAVALRVLEIYEQRGIYRHVAQEAPHFARRLQALADHELVGEVQSVGLLGAVDLVADKETRAMFDPAASVPARVQQAAVDGGLLLRVSGNRACFCPPMIITEAQIDELFDRFAVVLDNVRDAVLTRGGLQ